MGCSPVWGGTVAAKDDFLVTKLKRLHVFADNLKACFLPELQKNHS
jgi:hypothetical protein